MHISPWISTTLISQWAAVNQYVIISNSNLFSKVLWGGDIYLAHGSQYFSKSFKINQARSFIKGSLGRWCLYSPWVTIFDYFKINQVRSFLKGSFGEGRILDSQLFNFAFICRNKFGLSNQSRKIFFSQGFFGEAMSI